MKNVLEYVKEEHVYREPFPHIVAHNVLPNDIYKALASDFPSLETVIAGQKYGSNQRFDYTIKQLRSEKAVSSVWREFLEANASVDFFKKLIDLFGQSIQSLYPEFESTYRPLSELKPGIRYIDEHDNNDVDILLDAHLSINTPVTGKSGSVRVAHVDDPLKLYGGLLYFRTPEDDSKGGDLELYRYKRDDYKFYGQHVDDKYIEVIKTVPYEANTFVFFINSIRSLHGVTVRHKTTHTRQFMNIVGELPTPLFDIRGRQESIWLKRLRRYKAKITGQGGKW